MERPKKQCYFLKNKIRLIDFKDVNLLRRFLTDRGKILPRRITGTSARYQRMLCTAIKRARSAGLISYTGGYQTSAPEWALFKKYSKSPVSQGTGLFAFYAESEDNGVSV